MSGRDADFDRRIEEQKREREAALDALRPYFDFLRLANYGFAVPACKRVSDGLRALARHRRAANVPHGTNEEEQLAVRLCADTFANEIVAAATDEQDAATVAWVVAGLRCSWRPFCPGCEVCQTVTAPTRPDDPPVRSPW